MLLWGWIGLKPNSVFVGARQTMLLSCHLGKCISLSSRALPIQNIRSAFIKLNQMRRRSEIHLLTRGRVYIPIKSLVLLYCSELLRLKTDVWILSVFEHWCLAVSLEYTWRIPLVNQQWNTDSWVMQLSQWIRYCIWINYGDWNVLGTLANRLSMWALLSPRWVLVSTWVKVVSPLQWKGKEIFKGKLTREVFVSLPGWNARDPPTEFPAYRDEMTSLIWSISASLQLFWHMILQLFFRWYSVLQDNNRKKRTFDLK